MAIVHVRLDVDSDVHPELYAMLAAIDRAGSRSERVRQLASSGLIWEHLRLQGPVKVDIELGMDEAVEATRVAPLIAPPLPPPAPLPTPPIAALLPPPALPPIAPPRPVAPPPIAADVEDTATMPKRAARPRASPPRNLPILYDAVELGEDEGGKGAPKSAQAEPPAESAPESARKTGPRPRLMRMKEKGLFNNG
jgi:hypothetical protein